MIAYRRGRLARVLGAATLLAGGWLEPGQAQTAPRPLSLGEALRIADEGSEQVAIAKAAVERAGGERLRARSEYFPQLGATLGYVRTLASEFSSVDLSEDGPDGSTGSGCAAFVPDPTLPPAERLLRVERAVACASGEDSFTSFDDLPFGREHQLDFGLDLAQTVYAGGRVRAQNRIARSAQRSAEILLEQTRALLVMEVARAYWDALLADRLLEIAEATLGEMEQTLHQVRLARLVGDESEFEELRARVARDTQEPLVIQRQADRDIAHVRLRQLLELPLDLPLVLTTGVEIIDEPSVASLVAQVVELPLDTGFEERTPVLQAEEVVRVQEEERTIARSQRLPAVDVFSSWMRVAYPAGGIPTAWDEFRTNWAVSVRASVPIFTGGRIRGDEQVAQAALHEAEARLDQTRELAAVDTRTAHEQLEAAEATWRSTGSTVDEAQRTYHIAEVRFTEGLSTQLDLAHARVLLQHAEANRAVSARDLMLARLRVALIHLLPLAPLALPVIGPTQLPVEVPADPLPLGPQRALVSPGGLVAAPRIP
jgi:outer membrane protein TolC